MTTVATNHAKDEKRSADGKPASLADQAAAHMASPGTKVAPEKAPKPTITKTKALRLMLNILERTDPADRPSLLTSLGTLA